MPFFWTRQFDRSFQYVGYTRNHTKTYVEGDPNKDCYVFFEKGGAIEAVASVNRARGTSIYGEALKYGLRFTINDIKNGLTPERIQLNFKKGAGKCILGDCCK